MTITRTKTIHGNIEYKNEEGELHREDGPAVILYDGTKYWFRNDLRHRENGPAIETVNGLRYWYRNGKKHREDGPAFESGRSGMEWFLEGKQLTEEEFLEQTPFVGEIRLENGGRRFSSDGGVVIYFNSIGGRHREDGPAILCSNGTKEWWLNNQVHRTDGPALERLDGTKMWFIEGRELTEEEFLDITDPERSAYKKVLDKLTPEELELLYKGPPSSEVVKAEKKLRDIV